jgi:hypothetical protein
MLHVLRACMLNLLRVYFFADRERKVVIYYNLLPPPPSLSLSLYIYIYIYLLSDQSSATPNITIKVGFANFYKKILGLSRSK